MTVQHFETNGLDSKMDTPTKARHGETKNLESPKTATRESQVNGKLINWQTRQI